MSLPLSEASERLVLYYPEPAPSLNESPLAHFTRELQKLANAQALLVKASQALNDRMVLGGL